MAKPLTDEDLTRQLGSKNTTGKSRENALELLAKSRSGEGMKIYNAALDHISLEQERARAHEKETGKLVEQQTQLQKLVPEEPKTSAMASKEQIEAREASRTQVIEKDHNRTLTNLDAEYQEQLAILKAWHERRKAAATSLRDERIKSVEKEKKQSLAALKIREESEKRSKTTRKELAEEIKQISTDLEARKGAEATRKAAAGSRWEEILVEIHKFGFDTIALENLDEMIKNPEPLHAKRTLFQYGETMKRPSSEPESPAKKMVTIGDQGLVRGTNGRLHIHGVMYTVYLQEGFKFGDEVYLSAARPAEYTPNRYHLYKVQSFLRHGTAEKAKLKEEHQEVGGVRYSYRRAGPFRGWYTHQKQMAEDWVKEDVLRKVR